MLSMPAQFPTESTSDSLPVDYFWPQGHAHGAGQKCSLSTPLGILTLRRAATSSLIDRSWWINTPAPSLLSQCNSEAYSLPCFPDIPSRVKRQLLTVVPDLTMNASLASSPALSPFPCSPTHAPWEHLPNQLPACESWS